MKVCGMTTENLESVKEESDINRNTIGYRFISKSMFRNFASKNMSCDFTKQLIRRFSNAKRLLTFLIFHGIQGIFINNIFAYVISI